MVSLLKIFNPSFFDIFGIVFFIFLIVISVWELKNKRPLPKVIIFILLSAGIIGFVLDSISVYKAYFLGA